MATWMRRWWEGEQRHHLEALESERQRTKAAKYELKHSIRYLQQLEAENETLKRELTRKDEEIAESRVYLHTRTLELKEAEAFLSLEDEIPETEVVRIVHQLNASIFQTAASIADDPRFSTRAADGRHDRSKATSWIYPPLRDVISSVDDSLFTSAVQVALQSVIVRYVRAYLSATWDFGEDANTSDNLLDNLYARIREQGSC